MKSPRTGKTVAHTPKNVLRVIEGMCACECIGPDRHNKGEPCFPCAIFRLAHSVSSCRDGCPVKQEGRTAFEKAVGEGLY